MREFIIRADNNKFTFEGEIVHCKDCEYCEVSEATGVSFCCKFEFMNEPDGYCSYGKMEGERNA